MSGPGGTLALDLSSHVGWAYGRPFEKPLCGVWHLGKTEPLGRLLAGLCDELADAIDLHQPALVLYETPIAKHQTSALALLSLCGATELICYRREVRCRQDAAPTARKLVLGRGWFDGPKGRSEATKARVMDWCREQGWAPPDHNAGDALLLLRYAHILERGRVTA